MSTEGRRSIYVISDSTGETGAKVVQAALLQFRHEQVRLRMLSNMRDPEALNEAIDRAAAEGGSLAILPSFEPRFFAQVGSNSSRT